jgi:DNA-binding transcriptional LysR family regulator
MELRHLRYFVAVASARSVSVAARGLNVTQPGLSRQIQNLEQDLGVRLFDRIGRKIVLTGDGNELLGRARRILADAEAFRERAQALGGGKGGMLRIGATPQFIEAALPEVLARYHRARPGVEVQVMEDGASPLLIRVHQGELHLAIGALRAEGLQSRPLYPLRVLAVMSRQHRLARRRSLTVTDLVGDRFSCWSAAFRPGICSRRHAGPRMCNFKYASRVGRLSHSSPWRQPGTESPSSRLSSGSIGHGWPLRGCCTMDGRSVYGDAWSGTPTGTYQPTRATSSRSLHAARGRHIQVTDFASPARCLGRLMLSETIASNAAQVSCCVHALRCNAT